MFCNVLIRVLFYVVLICKESFSTDEIKPSQADHQLDAILSFPGWDRITNVGAKYRFSINGNASFTGKDLFVSGNRFVDNENSVNTFVGDHDENVKHYMATHLMACVYANATVRFVDLLKRILEVSYRATVNVRSQACQRKKKKLKKAEADREKEKNAANKSFEENSDRSQDRPSNEEEPADFKVPWIVFNFAVLQLTNSSSIFDRMYSAIKYLTDTIPSDESFDEFTRVKLVTLVLPSLKQFIDKSKNVDLVLPTYAGETDPDYNNKLGDFYGKFSSFLSGQAKKFLMPFIDQFCTRSEPPIPSVSEQIGFYKVSYRKQPTPLDVAYQFAIQISRLVHEEVCKKYYSELGFFYDIDKQTTSFQSPPTDSVIENFLGFT